MHLKQQEGTWEFEGDIRPYLDVFGVPPRMSAPWPNDVQGFWAGRHTVAEMKRTNRRKDWDQATALGLQMLRAGDCRGWHHIFDADTLFSLNETMTPATEIIAQRPVLTLAVKRDLMLIRAVQTEVDFWTHLNRLRLKTYEDAARFYTAAIRADPQATQGNLDPQHARRLSHAEKLLPRHPLRDYGMDRLITEAKTTTGRGLDPRLLEYLPDATLTWKSLPNRKNARGRSSGSFMFGLLAKNLPASIFSRLKTVRRAWNVAVNELARSSQNRPVRKSIVAR